MELMSPPRRSRRARWPLALAAVLGLGLAVDPAAAQPLERARAAQARGDLRAAQIELRNAVRSNPNSAALRAALAAASIDVGDGDTAEKEARAALERGHDATAGTVILLRSYLIRNRFQELLRDLPMPPEGGDAALAGEIAAGRALAELALRDVEAARKSVEDALRLAPTSANVHLAAASLALSGGDRATAEAALDRALAINPDFPEVLLRKAALLFARGENAQAIATLDHLLAKAPSQVQGRLLRAEVRLRAGDPAAAKQDVDAVLRVMPNSAGGNYLRAAMLVRDRDWTGADTVLQRMGSALGNFPDGFLLLATVKRALNQSAQALDAVSRHIARRPEDPRGAKLLATMEMDAGRPAGAAGALEQLAARGGADAEAYDMLGRALSAARRPREAAQALAKAVELAPNDAAIRTRLAAARLAAGDTVGTTAAAQEALRLAPEQQGPREMLALAALGRGDLAAAEAELAQIAPAARQNEVPATVAAMLQLARLQLAEARTSFEAVLRRHPESVGARIGLARVGLTQGTEAEPERLLGEVLRRQPGQGEALSRLTTLASSGGGRAPAARAALAAAQAAAPGETNLALAMAQVLQGAGDTAGALAVLDAEALRAPGHGVALPLARAQLYIALEKWPEAEATSRAALAEAPDNAQARRQLASLLIRGGDARGAEALLQEGLRSRPAEPALQQALIALINQSRGLDAALAAADRLAQQPEAQPQGRLLRGELLLASQRPADAARAYATALAAAPSVEVALRTAGAWLAANQRPEAEKVLTAWLQRVPEEVEALNMLAQFDIQDGRTAAAIQRLTTVVQRAPNNAVALNNLAWVTAQEGTPAALERARTLSERAYFLLPTPETADTFGWILTRLGQPQQALPLLRAAVSVGRRGSGGTDPGGAYRLAFTLKAAGDRAEAQRIIDLLLANPGAFPERAEAERLQAELRAGR